MFVTRSRNPESTVGPTVVGPGKSFQNKDSQVAGKRYLGIGFANVVFNKRAVLKQKL